MGATCAPVPVHQKFWNTFPSPGVVPAGDGHFHAGEDSPLRFFGIMQPTKLGLLPAATSLTGMGKADSTSKFAKRLEDDSQRFVPGERSAGVLC